MVQITGVVDVVAYCLRQFAGLGASRFGLLLLTAFGVAALGWITASNYAKLWNRRYKPTWEHHALCGVAAVFAFIFVLLFSALQFTQDVAKVIVTYWEKVEIQKDENWRNQAFAKAYGAVKALNIEDFGECPAPEKGGNCIPTNQDKSREVSATVYSQEAVRHFNKNHPILRKVLKTNESIPQSLILSDLAEFFRQHPGESYPVSRAIQLASRAISSDLSEQAPKTVTRSRYILVAIFIVFELIPFFVIGYAAYKDIKIAS